MVKHDSCHITWAPRGSFLTRNGANTNIDFVLLNHGLRSISRGDSKMSTCLTSGQYMSTARPADVAVVRKRPSQWLLWTFSCDAELAGATSSLLIASCRFADLPICHERCLLLQPGSCSYTHLTSSSSHLLNKYRSCMAARRTNWLLNSEQRELAERGQLAEAWLIFEQRQMAGRPVAERRWWRATAAAGP